MATRELMKCCRRRGRPGVALGSEGCCTFPGACFCYPQKQSLKKTNKNVCFECFPSKKNRTRFLRRRACSEQSSPPREVYILAGGAPRVLNTRGGSSIIQGVSPIIPIIRNVGLSLKILSKTQGPLLYLLSELRAASLLAPRALPRAARGSDCPWAAKLLRQAWQA